MRAKYFSKITQIIENEQNYCKKRLNQSRISPGDSVQEEYGPFALNGDISTDFHQTLVFIMLGVELLLEYCQRVETKQ